MATFLSDSRRRGRCDSVRQMPNDTMRLLTFNIRHGEGLDDRLDLGRIAEVIAAQDADVVALQEVDRHFGERSGFADQAWILGRHLEMSAVFGGEVRQPPPAPGQPPREYGSAVLSRLPIMAWRFVPLPTWPGHEGRGVLFADLAIGQHSVRVGSAHLSYEDPQPRLAQTRLLQQIITDDARPTVLAGDFNARPDDVAFPPLTEVLSDAWATAGTGEGFTFPADQPEVRIDYVLTTSQLTVEAVEVINIGVASDHRPVLATMSL